MDKRQFWRLKGLANSIFGRKCQKMSISCPHGFLWDYPRIAHFFPSSIQKQPHLCGRSLANHSWRSQSDWLISPFLLCCCRQIFCFASALFVGQISSNFPLRPVKWWWAFAANGREGEWAAVLSPFFTELFLGQSCAFNQKAPPSILALLAVTNLPPCCCWKEQCDMRSPNANGTPCPNWWPLTLILLALNCFCSPKGCHWQQKCVPPPAPPADCSGVCRFIFPWPFLCYSAAAHCSRPSCQRWVRSLEILVPSNLFESMANFSGFYFKKLIAPKVSAVKWQVSTSLAP